MYFAGIEPYIEKWKAMRIPPPAPCSPTLPVTLSCLAWDAKRYFNIIDWQRKRTHILGVASGLTVMVRATAPSPSTSGQGTLVCASSLGIRSSVLALGLIHHGAACGTGWRRDARCLRPNRVASHDGHERTVSLLTESQGRSSTRDERPRYLENHPLKTLVFAVFLECVYGKGSLFSRNEPPVKIDHAFRAGFSTKSCPCPCLCAGPPPLGQAVDGSSLEAQEAMPVCDKHNVGDGTWRWSATRAI